MDKTKGVGIRGGRWGWLGSGEWWGQNADNCTWTTIKKRKETWAQMWPLLNVETACQEPIHMDVGALWFWFPRSLMVFWAKEQAHNDQDKHQLSLRSCCKDVVTTLPILLQNSQVQSLPVTSFVSTSNSPPDGIYSLENGQARSAKKLVPPGAVLS